MLLLLLIGLAYFLIFAPRLVTGKEMMYGSDWLGGGGYPLREWITDSMTTTKRLPMWTPMVSSGLPTVAAPYGDVVSVWALIRFVVSTHTLWTYKFILGVWLAGLGAYLFLQTIGLKRWTSFLGGLIYMFSGSIVSMTYAGHESKVMGAALFPFILIFFHKGLMTHRFPHFVFAGALTGISFLNGHLQLSYYALLACGCYFVLQMVWQRRKNGGRENLKLLLFSVVALGVMFGVIAISYLPMYGYIPYGTRGEERGYEFATSWAMPPWELFDLVTPHFSGLLTNYWGENYFKYHTEYLGFLPLILAGIALGCRIRDRYTRFFLALCLGAVLMSLGGHTPFYRIPYHLLPMVKKFRASGMAFCFAAFSFSVLAAIGLQALSEGKVRTRSLVRGLVVAAAVLGVCFLFVLLAKNSFLPALTRHFRPVLTARVGSMSAEQKLSTMATNYPSFLGGLGKALILMIISGLLIWALAARKISSRYFLVALVPIFLFDVWSVQRRFLKSVPHPRQYYAPDEVVGFLERDAGLYRVFPLYYERADDGIMMLHGVQSVGGNTGNPLGTYQEFIGAGGSVMFRAPNLYNKNLLGLLNVKYVVSVALPEDISRYDEGTQRALRELGAFVNQPWLRLAFQGRRYAIYENRECLPRAFLAPTYQVVSREEILARLKEESFDPRKVVILEEEPGVPSAATETTSVGEARVSHYEPNRIVVEADLVHPAWLVLSENYHPSWKARVDGEGARVYRANYTQRAVHLPDGRHTIELVYDSPYFRAGALISSLTFLFLLGTIVYWFRRR